MFKFRITIDRHFGLKFIRIVLMSFIVIVVWVQSKHFTCGQSCKNYLVVNYDSKDSTYCKFLVFRVVIYYRWAFIRLVRYLSGCVCVCVRVCELLLFNYVYGLVLWSWENVDFSPNAFRAFLMLHGRGIKSELESVWPDVAKFHHFGKILKLLGNLLRVQLVLGEILNPLWQIFHSIWQIFIVLNGPKH